VNYKIREAQLQKIPYMLVVGDREAANRQVSLRTRKGGDLGARALDEVVAMISEKSRTRSVED
jgi:threonyl-tRNA synthetase